MAREGLWEDTEKGWSGGGSAVRPFMGKEAEVGKLSEGKMGKE